VHGFPLDWNLWQIGEWPAKVVEIETLVEVPVWVTEVGVSSFGAEEVQAWGLSVRRNCYAGMRREFTGTASMIFRLPGGDYSSP